MSGVNVICPSCFEEFEVPAPHPGEVPCALVYECEACCRHMRLAFDEQDGPEVYNAYWLGDNAPGG